jgi:hypothetical protein
MAAEQKKTRRFPQLLLRGYRDNQGLAMLEFALVLPILLIMVLGGIEICRMVLFNQKIDNATSGVADAITRLDYDDVPCSELDYHYNLLDRMVQPFDLEGSMVVSAIEASYPNENNQDNSRPLRQIVTWQWTSGGDASRIGTEGGRAQGAEWPLVFRRSPNDGGMYSRDRIIAVEVFSTYRTIIPGIEHFLNIDAVTQVYKKAFYRARFGNMSDLEGGC